MRDRRPNIKTLLKREKVDALVAAAYYREPTPNPSGGVSDAGVPVRAEAILALGKLGPTAGRRAVLAGLRDPADPVRCAAVRALHARRDPYALVRALEWLPSEGRSRLLALQTVLDPRRDCGRPDAAKTRTGRRHLAEHCTRVPNSRPGVPKGDPSAQPPAAISFPNGSKRGR